MGREACTTTIPARRETALRERLEQVLAEGGAPLLRRLARAGVSVEFRIAGPPLESVTLLLDRFPPRVGDGPGEIELELTSQQALELAAGRLDLCRELYLGTVRYAGPVRSFMAVAPVVCARLAAAP